MSHIGPQMVVEMAPNAQGVNMSKLEYTEGPPISPDADHEAMGSLQGYFTTSYAKLVEMFGPPNDRTDRYKVSTEWDLVTRDGVPFRLYDYKNTDLYDSEMPSVEDFRALPSFEWHIGCETPEQAKRIFELLTQMVASHGH